MRIGIAGPMNLRLLRGVDESTALPEGYDHPPMSNLVNALWDRGLDVTVFTTSLGLKNPFVLSLPRLTICVGGRHQRAGRRLFRCERRELVHLMRQHAVDLINAHWSYEFAWAALDSGTPTLVTLRDHARTILKQNFDAFRLARFAMDSYVVRRAPFLSTNSRYLYAKLSPRQRKKARVTQNFFVADLVGLRKSYRNRDNYIVSVSNGFRGRKNIASALRAFGLLRQSCPGIRYYLFGNDMEAGGPAETFARRKGLAQGVVFMGKQPYRSVLDCVRNAKLMLHPSLEESFGMSVLEAMVLGTPVVGGARSGNIPFLLDYGKAGVVCDVRVARDIARSASMLLADETGARRLAEYATNYATQHFSEERAVQAYLDYYADILQKARA